MPADARHNQATNSQWEGKMTYRKALEKQGFPEFPSGGSSDQPPVGSFAGGDDNGPPSAGNAADAGDSDSGPVSTFGDVGIDLNLPDVLSRAVQVGPLLDSDCQPCADSDSSSGGSVSIDVDAGLDTNGLAIAPQGLCLPDLSALSLPVLSDLLAGGDYTGDHDDGTGSAAADAPCGCDSATGNAGAEDRASTQSGVSISADLDLGGNTSTDVLSALLNGTPLLRDAAQPDGLLGGAILADCGDAENSAGVSVDPAMLPTLDGVLHGLVASTDLLHLFDCGDCIT